MEHDDHLPSNPARDFQLCSSEHFDLFYGDKADKILKSFELTDAQAKEYERVKGKFNSHFIKRRNIIFERAIFNKRK